MGLWANPSTRGLAKTKDVVASLAMAHGTPSWGGEYSRERLAGVAPDGPPLTSGFILVSFTGKFADILGLVGW